MVDATKETEAGLQAELEKVIVQFKAFSCSNGMFQVLFTLSLFQVKRYLGTYRCVLAMKTTTIEVRS